MRYGSAEKKVPGKLVDFQGAPPPRMAHPGMQKVKQQWQEACMNEQEAPVKIRTIKEGSGDPEVISEPGLGKLNCIWT